MLYSVHYWWSWSQIIWHSTSPSRMPTMTRKNDFIIWLFLTPDQQRIYGDFLSLDTVKEVRGHGDWWCYTWDGYNVENEKPKFNLILILGLWSAVLSACIPYFQKFFFLYSTCISYLLAYTSVYVNCVLSQSSIILSSIL